MLVLCCFFNNVPTTFLGNIILFKAVVVVAAVWNHIIRFIIISFGANTKV